MLLGLKGEDKMSKSDPDSAIYMDDLESDVNRKIKKAYCPIGQKDKNPISYPLTDLPSKEWSMIFWGLFLLRRSPENLHR